LPQTTREAADAATPADPAATANGREALVAADQQVQERPRVPNWRAGIFDGT
jgi:hypothetical protein